MNNPSASTAAAVAAGPDPGRWKSLAVILAAALLVCLDFFVVNARSRPSAPTCTRPLPKSN